LSGGPGGTGGIGGNGGTLSINYLDPLTTPVNPTCDISGGAGGKAGPTGAGGSGGAPGPGGAPGYHIVHTHRHHGRSGASGTKGSAGISTNPGTQGASGTVGTFLMNQIPATNSLTSLSLPLQIYMMLSQVQFHFLMRYTMMALCPGLSTPKDFADEPNVQYVKEVLAWMGTLGLGAVPTNSPFKRESDLYAVIKGNIALGFDYYHNNYNYVPILSFNWQNIEILLTSFGQLQDARDDGYAQLQQGQASIQKLQNAYDKLSSSSESNNAKKDQLITNLRHLSSSIPSQQSVVNGLQTELTSTISSYKARLEKSINCQWENVMMAVGATTMMAACTGGEALPLLGVAAGGALEIRSTIAMNQGNVNCGPGVDVNKNYLIAQLGIVQDAVKNYTTLFTEMKNGLIQSDGGNVGVLVADKQEFMALYQQYFSNAKGFQGTGEKINAMFQQLIDAAEKLNSMILRYNNDVTAIGKIVLEDSENAIYQSRLSYGIEQLNEPLLQLLLKALNFYYTQQLDFFIYELYCANRIYKCLTLKDSDAMAGLAQLQSSSLLDFSLVQGAYTSLLTDFTTFSHSLAVNQRSKLEVTVKLKGESFGFSLASLQRGKPFTFSLPCIHRTTSTPAYMQQFFGHANVRILSMNVYLLGLQPGNTRISLNLENNGCFTVVQTDDSWYQFNCPFITQQTVYTEVGVPLTKPGPDAQFETQISLLDSSVPLSAPLLSPYGGVWTVSLTDPSMASQLPLSQVTGVQVNYKCYVQAFDTQMSSSSSPLDQRKDLDTTSEANVEGVGMKTETKSSEQKKKKRNKKNSKQESFTSSQDGGV
jgi:hypothetical protein